MNVFAGNFFRRVLGDFLDIHAAFGAGDDRVAARRAILQDGKVKLLGDVDRLADEDLADELALGSGLMRDQGLAEHLAREIARLCRC